MSRTRRAWAAAGFSYAQTAVAIVNGIVLIPFILKAIAADQYGLWLASVELVGLIGLADLGVLNVLPMLIAQEDGRRDGEAIRRLVSAAAAVACATAVAMAVIALILLFAFAKTQTVSGDQSAVLGPLLTFLALQLASYPLRAFLGLLVGRQDVNFWGVLFVATEAARAVATLGLLWAGVGLYALAVAQGGAALAISVGVLLRAFIAHRAYVLPWQRPDLASARLLVVEGLGAWLACAGWKLSTGSSGLILLALSGNPALVAVYATTAKVATVLTPRIWTLTDSALVGLAQLYGEGRLARCGEVGDVLLKLTLFVAGGFALGLLAFNPAFVRIWVGPEFYAGPAVNILIAVSVLSQSIGHLLAANVASIGHRLRVGLSTLAEGTALVMIAAAIGLGGFPLVGVAAASASAALLTTIPIGWRLWQRTLGGDSPSWQPALGSWLWRSSTLLIVAGVTGVVTDERPVYAAAASAVLGAFYVWLFLDQLREIPLPRLPFGIGRRQAPCDTLGSLSSAATKGSTASL